MIRGTLDSKLTLSDNWSRRDGPSDTEGSAGVRSRSRRDIQRATPNRAHHPRSTSSRTSMSRLSLFSWWGFCDWTLSRTTQTDALVRTISDDFHKKFGVSSAYSQIEFISSRCSRLLCALTFFSLFLEYIFPEANFCLIFFLLSDF